MQYGPRHDGQGVDEMIHRYLAMAVGVLIIAMLVISVRRLLANRRSLPPARPRAYPGLVVGLLALVVLQGAFGAWTVTQKLQPIFVTTHLLLGLSLFAALTWHALRFEPTVPLDVGRATRVLALVTAGVAVVQIALGGWVSANYAVLACSDFPRCQGVWLPSMDFAHGFAPWPRARAQRGRLVPVDRRADRDPLDPPHVRRGGARVRRGAGVAAASLARLAPPGRALVAVLSLPLATGLVNVVFAWPLVAAVLHNAGAAALVATLVVINYRLRPPAGAPVSSPLSRGPIDRSERLFARPTPTSSSMR